MSNPSMSETRNTILAGLRATRARLRALPPVRPVWWDPDPITCEARRLAWAAERHRRARAYWRGSYGALELARAGSAARKAGAVLGGKVGQGGAFLVALDEAAYYHGALKGQVESAREVLAQLPVAGELAREVEEARRLLRWVPTKGAKR